MSLHMAELSVCRHSGKVIAECFAVLYHKTQVWRLGKTAAYSSTLQVSQIYAKVNGRGIGAWCPGAAVQETGKACECCTSYACVFHPAVTAACLMKGTLGALLHFLLILLKQKFYTNWNISLKQSPNHCPSPSCSKDVPSISSPSSACSPFM